MRLFRLIVRDENLPLLGLGAATGACLALLAVRVLYTHTLGYGNLAWNLFLAWVPVLLALAARRADRLRLGRWLLVPCLGLAWLLFFPNAPYLVTNLVYPEVYGSVLSWYDVLMALSFAVTGLCAGFVSLYAMHDLVTRVLGTFAGGLLVLSVIGLSGVGVYLGRFLRWNSWDVLFDPGMIARFLLDGLAQPRAYMRPAAFSAVFAACFALIYVALFALTRLRSGAAATTGRGGPR